jgi:cytochrome c5
MRRSQLICLTCCILLPPAVLAMGSVPPQNVEAANARIQPLAKVALASGRPVVAPGSRSGEDIYKAVCGACHDSGAANAPKAGDAAAWSPRIKKGLPALVKSVSAGLNAMPPRGGSDATDEELKRAVIFIANKSGGSFK